MSARYAKSEEMLARALRTIPLGTQTFSKSKTQYPLGVSPFYLTRGRGSHVFDVDGNEYVDFVNGLAAVTLGYDDPDVLAAVGAQLQDGVLFSLPHPIEVEVAELVVEMVPCAEAVRFGKNGSDATAGAVRVARAYTGRDHVAVCGYHGWQDWYIGSTPRNLGVPESTRAMTHQFAYDDLDSLAAVFRAWPGQVAAVIMEPMNVVFPSDGYLEEVQDMAHRNGALLILDEVVTGFRLAKGGAQEYFGVTPDLATFGKGIANGYPLAVVAGRADVMRLMEEVFFSFTFGGEALSLAAARATMLKLQREPVIEALALKGTEVQDRTRALIQRHGISDVLDVTGHPSWSFLVFKDAGGYGALEIKTLFLQEMFARGILILSTHNMSYAHSAADIEALCGAYEEVFGQLDEAVHGATLRDRLRCEPLEPLFKLR